MKILPAVLIALVAGTNIAMGAPVTYHCQVQSVDGGLGTIMDSVTRIIIDEAERSIEFRSDDETAQGQMNPAQGTYYTFRSNLSYIAAASQQLSSARSETFVLQVRTGLATHSYTVADGVASVTWTCGLAAARSSQQ